MEPWVPRVPRIWGPVKNLPRRYVFCGTCRPRALKPASRTLSGTLPCGVRTFLSRQARSRKPRQRPPGPPASLQSTAKSGTAGQVASPLHAPGLPPPGGRPENSPGQSPGTGQRQVLSSCRDGRTRPGFAQDYDSLGHNECGNPGFLARESDPSKYRPYSRSAKGAPLPPHHLHCLQCKDVVNPHKITDLLKWWTNPPPCKTRRFL